MIKISIICITYNQEKFIKSALGGFIMQNTNFEFEILVHDDASTDSTVKILKEFKKKYPDKINLLLEKDNQFQKNNYKFIDKMFQSAKGKYIAFCEGDDYWTDPLKLQKQVDFLDMNPSYSICFHPVKVQYEDSKTSGLLPETIELKSYNLNHLLRNNFIPTNSVVYRKQDYKNLNCNALPIDWYLHLYHARNGKIGFIPDVMGVYRKHTGGVWWEGISQKKAFWHKYWLSHIIFFTKVLDLFKNDKDAIKAVYTTIGRVFSDALLYSDKKNKILEKIVDDYPEFSKIILKAQAELVDEDKNTIERLAEKNYNLDRLNHQNIYTIEKLQLDYDGAVNSISWKVTKPLRAVKKVVKKKR